MSGPELKRQIAIATALMIALLLIALVVLVNQANSARENALRWERHNYDVLLTTQRFQTAMAQSEAALKSFVISGDPATGTRYYDEWVHAGQLLDTLRHVAQTSQHQQQNLARLAKLYDQRREELARPATLATYKRQWAAYKAVGDADKTATGPALRAALTAVGEEERRLLDLRRTRVRYIADWSNLLQAILSAVGVLLILGACVLGWTALRAIANSRTLGRRAEYETERAQILEAAVAARTQELSDANARLRAEAHERELAEAQLRQMQKMEAVGQLTGGIAHDFNNMLAVVVGGLDMAKRKLARETQEVERHLENAMEGANRAASLTRRLLAFSRQQPLEPEGVDVNQLIGGMADLIRRTLGERIEVGIRLEADPAQIWADPNQLENAILNLAVNARDAMPDGGRLEILTSHVAITRPSEDSPAGIVPGDYVRIAVIDSGSGMPPEVLERAFEPFFTTKPVGRGTGLGLSQIFGFVRQSAGEAMIQSTMGIGTTVTLYLPHRADAPEETLLDPEPDYIEAPKPADASEAETVLVVEDEPRVRAATVTALTELGYQVIACDGGAEALNALSARPGIQLLLSDVIMPEMTGPELVKAAKHRRPDLRVLFTTGFAGEAAGEHGEGMAGYPVLHKPFTIRHLAEKVREALDRAA